MRTEQEQEPGCRVVFIGQQRNLTDALEFVNEDAAEVAFLGFAYFWRGDDGLHGIIDIGFLVRVQALVGAVEDGTLENLDFRHL